MTRDSFFRRGSMSALNNHNQSVRQGASPSVDHATSSALPKPDHHWAYDIPRPIASVGFETTLSTTKETEVHSHRKAQLLLTLSGIVTCEVDNSAWIVPPDCAVWIPGGSSHSLKASGKLKIYGVFVDPEVTAAMPSKCCTIRVSPLLRELLLHTASFPALYDMAGPEGRLVEVLLDQLMAAPHENLHFPVPHDARLRKIAAAMQAAPAEHLTVAEWGHRVGASERTLARILRAEAGMSFGRWRQQLHVLRALQHLAEGAAVQVVAQELGYESASAFITMFRKAMGKSPARYLAERESDISTSGI